MPLLTVFMPVYNAEPYLAQAIDSILGQTFGDFEFLIVDDGSTDGSAEVVSRYTDPRIRLIRKENQGCYPARNRAIAEARGEYLANMDADDISLPERFEKQISYLKSNPEAVLVGTRALGCDRMDSLRLPQPDGFKYDSTSSVPYAIRKECTQGSAPFACQAILFRRSLVDRMGAYDTRLCYCADVDLVARAAWQGVVGCLPDYLYVFRILPEAISGAGSHIQREILAIIKEASQRATSEQGRDFTAGDVARLNDLSRLRQNLPQSSKREKDAFYETRIATLLRANGKFGEAIRHALRAVLCSPDHLRTDRKLSATLIKAVLRRR
jgi:glycosyltransferase involved in cell wall biosynthesis